MNIKERVEKMDALVSQGAMVDAITQNFSSQAKTSDYGGVSTSSQEDMVAKMEGFLGAIAKVNGITHHQSLVDGNTSASEFTFDFDMKDGSKIFWHEIIKREWNEEGKIIREEYFDAKN